MFLDPEISMCVLRACCTLAEEILAFLSTKLLGTLPFSSVMFSLEVLSDPSKLQLLVSGRSWKRSLIMTVSTTLACHT